ncbi:MAG: M36 family metallopeptidase, partial [Prosthecobacter sp.]
MKKASSILAILVMAGATAGWWLDTRSRPAAPEQTASPAPVSKPRAAQAKPQVKLIRAAARKVTEIDVREAGRDGTTLLPDRLQALAALRAAIPGSTVEFDPITGAPSQIQATGRFLTGRSTGLSARDVVGGFIERHAALFGHGSAALKSARVTRDDVTQHSGMSTVVWNQEVDGIPVFKTILKANLTKHGELITINDHFVADPTPNRAAPAINAERAVFLAANSVQSTVAESSIVAQGNAQGPERHQAFTAPGLSDTSALLTYLPMNESEVRLGWDVTLFSIEHDEMFRTVVDAESGTVLYRTSLTADISNATYRVYGDATSKKPFDSPQPMMPGHSTPLTTEPAEVPRQLITLPALDTTASPNGWINDGGQETLGNNVDAHTDIDFNNSPDLPRPNGGPTRTFDLSASLSLAPSTYKDAAAVNLFYVCNWVHDRLYQLGFTESAGNFQTSNFGRGGLGNDAILADAQDGSGTNNSNFSTPADGGPGRLQMYLWTAPDPDRDSSLDTHIIIHEYAHGLSNRLVGGGVGMTAWQSLGMGEGWSDFYALCLTSDPSQDPNAVYPMAPYSARLLLDVVDSNYYFGIRRYPYCTDMAKSPLTFKDIDYRQAGTHVGVPLSPRYGSPNSIANQVHAIGEVWCGMLWEVRAALMAKHGHAPGNERVLQLVTDALKLSPANPNFIQSRNAILQADLVLSGGADAAEITAAFAKRGLGVEATSPASQFTDGVVESFDVPDALKVTPLASFTIEATRITGPIFPASQTFTVKNTSNTAATWTATSTQSWLSLAPAGGTLAPGASVLVQGTAAANVVSMPAGTYEDTVVFTNTATGVVRRRPATLKVNPLLARAALFNLDADPLWAREGEWAFGVPTGTHPEYGAIEPSRGFTGSNVFGIVLTGAHSGTPGPFAYLTSGPISTTGMQNVTLRFKRWMNQQVQPGTYATVDVSNDGITWTNVWQNSSNDHVIESGWSTQTYALGPLADNQPAVHVRWGHRVAMTITTPMGGWNIDDVEFLSETTTPGLTATTQNLTTAINTPVGFTLGGINAGNPAAPQVVNVLSLPANGTLTGTAPNLIYTPNPGFSGVDSFPFTVTSEGTTSTPACVVITVLPGPPDASVEFPDGTELADGGGVADFGPLAVGLTSLRQVLIKNASGGPLSLLSFRVDGAHGVEFTLGSPAQSLLAPGESTYLPVTWAPRFVGTKRAALHILTNDPDEDSYDIIINGTATAFDGGVRLTRDIGTGTASIGSLRNVRGNLMFLATSSTGGITLWTSQGTPETTLTAEDVMAPGNYPTAMVQLTAVGSRASFYTGSGSGTTIGMWNSDGTLAGSYRYLSDSTPFFDYGSRPTQFAAVGETLFFSAGSSAAQGAELWKSNGTSAGTALVKDINPTTNAGSLPANMKAFNGLLWFTANDGANGVELWKSDGTTAGTVLVKDIEAGANSSTPTMLNGAGSRLFFSAATAANGRELHASDGTTAGTILLKDCLPGSASGNPTSLVPLGNVMLFGATDVTAGQELFKSDGTVAGTVMVKDIRAGGSGSGAQPRLAVNDIVYLVASDGTNGTELWKTDGTAVGTVMVKDIYAGAGSSNPT